MKPLQLTLLVLFCLFSLNIAELYNCQFGHLYRNRSLTLENKPRQYQKQYEKKHVRNLAGIVRNSLRITLDTTDFSTLKASEDGANQTTTTKLDFIKRAMQVAQRFYELRLKVTSSSVVKSPVVCFDHNTPSTDQTSGISNSDLHIYVLYVTSQVKTYGATGINCQTIITGNGFPDTTFSQGRPDVGRMIFNTYRLVDQQSSLTNRLFASVTSTALHQTLHILGFDSNLYATYLDASGNLYSSTTSTIQYYSTRSVTTLLTTPAVTAWAKDFFGCNNITGMQLQDEDGGTIGSHWERLVMYDELMTGTSMGAQKGISALTFALMKDMGWYEVDDTFNDTTNYGYHKGCQLWENACNSSTVFDYFCDPTALSGYTKCASNFLSKARCFDANGASSNGLMSNRCSMFFPYLHCVDPNQVDDGYKAYALEAYGTSSFCVSSTMGTINLQSQYQARCYQYTCYSANTSIVFTISSAYTIVCASSDAGNQKTSSGLSGYLICPVYQDYCVQSRKICPNWCSKNGFCMRGICNCLPGYSGQDCSKTICTSSQFYNPSTGTCLGTCGTGTYQNIYSRTCMPCDSKCSECRDQSTICSSCPVSTPQQVFYQDNCLDQCPSTTYVGGTNGDTCIDCDQATSKCISCVFGPTNCTSCSSADGTTRYLFPTDGTTLGLCVTGCYGDYSFHDVVNFLCVADCTQNLVIKNGNQCDKCDLNYYKNSTGQCSLTCGSTYYADPDLRQCIQCKAPCKTCDGSFTENCTSCNPSSSTNQKYLLLKMCLTSCPRGFYPNDNTNRCQICPVSNFCTSCIISGVDIFCTACKYGYFYQVNQTCTLDCDTDRFKNTWNHSCDPCSTECLTCIGPQDNSCLTCDSSKLFLTNTSGGYCLANCPTQGYVSDGTNCKACHFTCESCNGQASTNCITCKTGLYKSQSVCRYVCPSKFYQNEDTNSCDPCDSTCLYCSGPGASQCLLCNSNTYLFNSACLTSCPESLPPNKWNVCFASHQFVNLILGLIILIIAF